MQTKYKEEKKIKVKALPDFHYRRLITLKGLTKKEFRDLQQGKSILINENYFDSKIYEKVKEDGSRQRSLSSE